MLAALFILLSLTFCTKESEEDTSIPSDLTVTVLNIDETSREVEIQASANNAVNYELYIGVATTPSDESENGFFRYTFEADGRFEISVRAYGSSGKYLQKSSELVIDTGEEPVPVGQGYSTPLSYEGYSLVWNDEFSGSGINSSDWTFEIGDGCPNLCGWGNNELQYYRSENAWVENDVLTIEARKENYGGRAYTSSRMITQQKQSFQYGRIDIRALLPEGQGIWPALWMLGENITSNGWPACGEIDIMELVGGTGDNTVHGTVHYDNGGHVYEGEGYTLSSGVFSDEYHVFSLIWDSEKIRIYVDDQKYFEKNITDANLSEFHKPFFLIFNIAVGGNWPGNPDQTTVFPQQMKVDYVRVFQEN